MKELIQLLELNPGSWYRIAVLGKCFSLIRYNDDAEGLIRIKNCRSDESFEMSSWEQVADFIRGKVIDRIAINDETLYEIALVELSIAYVNQNDPEQEPRLLRIRRLTELAESEPVFTKLMHYLFR